MWNGYEGVCRPVEELEQAPGRKLMLVEPRETKERYPIPAAFYAYTGYWT